MKTAVFGGGCFWCTEAVFQNLKGVSSVRSGYAGGHTEDPTYEQVATGTTGHAEVIEVNYNPDIIHYETLLDIFFASHDPTTPNRQGHDLGSQYRSVILYIDDDQKSSAEKYIQNLEAEKVFPKPIVTELKKLDKFYPAETYHTDYYLAHAEQPYCQVVISPKLAKIRKKFSNLMKE